MKYIWVQFTEHAICQAYQVQDDTGKILGYKHIDDGSDMLIPENAIYHELTMASPVHREWMDKQ